MDNNKNKQYTNSLADMVKNHIESSKNIANLILSPEYEESILANLTPEKREEFKNAQMNSKEGLEYQAAKEKLKKSLEEINNLGKK